MLALNVADAPEQMVVPDALVIEIVGATVALTFIVMLFDVPVVGLAHAEFDVTIQRTTCPLVKAVVVKAALLFPALTPPTCH